MAACNVAPAIPGAGESESDILAFPSLPGLELVTTNTDMPVQASGISVQESGSHPKFTTVPLPPVSSTLPPVTVSVTIPEGFTYYQVAQRLEANGVCTALDFHRVAQLYEVQSFAVPYSRDSAYYLEGFLFPDTYEFYKNEDPTAVLRKILNNYAAKSGLPDYDTLILASIIERETRSDAHMAMVSSVLHNRLKINMRLQTDANRLYVEHHIKPSPLVAYNEKYAELYNTYKCDGLPAGPICNPGLRAINAAKNPAESDYLFYFFGMDNDNHYTKTYDEHLAAIKVHGVNYGLYDE